MPLRYWLIFPIVLQMLIIMGLVGWLVCQNKQESAQRRSQELRENSVRQVQSYLEQTLAISDQIHQINLAAIQLGMLSTTDLKKMGQYFWKQAQTFNLSRIDYATPQGNLIGIEQAEDGTWQMHKIAAANSSFMITDRLDRQGNRFGMSQVLAGQVPIQKTPWFVEATQVKAPIWSRVNPKNNRHHQELIFAIHPILTRENKFIGALRIGFSSSQISQFLSQLKVTYSGRIFIFERAGRFIASSQKVPRFPGQVNSDKEIYTTQSLDPLISQTTQYLEQTFTHLSQIKSPTQVGFQLHGQQHIAQIVPWPDRYGLDWLIVVVEPEFDPTITQDYNLIGVGLVVLMITISLAWLTARWISQPILWLRQAVQDVAKGSLDDLVGTTPIQELDQLRASLNHMAQHMQESFITLKTANVTLEQQITQKTSELLASETKFAKVFRASPNAIAITTIEEGLFVEANESFCTLMEYELEEVIGSTCYDLDCWADRGERAKILQLLQQRGAVSNYACQLRTKSGRILDGEISAQIIYLNDHTYLLLTSTDITARKQAEAQIQASLREKEVLLKEVHHRVKNNLHIVSNLLDLQSDQITDATLLELFAESQSRIQAMALIHEQLYQSDDLGQVDFGEYIRRLVDNLAVSYGKHLGAVTPIIQTELILLNLETAVPCGLLINELITNSFKHAFPGPKTGQVHIELYQQNDRQIYLNVWDNGIGIPPDLDWQTSSSLGLKLVRILARQLKATLTITTESGTRVALMFSELKYRPRF